MLLMLMLLALILSSTILLVLIRMDVRKNRRLLEKVSDEGYETALEVLRPDHKFIFRNNTCGPVLANR